MAKAARRYDFYLPIAFNDGRPIPEAQFYAVENRLLDRFGGVTAQQREFPLRGIWFGGSQQYLDQVIIMTALDFRRKGSAAFIADIKRDLLHDFDQLAILITEAPLKVH